MDNTKPYYIILLIILVFIFLWFFFGGQEVDFVGLRPLHPDHILEYQDASFQEQLPYPVTRQIKEQPKEVELPSVNEQNSMKDVCVDLTPQLPPEFTTNICFNEDNKNGGKFESKGEKICRQTLERVFGTKFPNQRPNWLINDRTGHALEIDCYNESLKLGVEYSGIFHSVYP